MIGASFVTFLVLLVESLIAAWVLHYVFRYRLLDGLDGFIAKWVVAWMGAWLGSPVLGHWFESSRFGDVYLIPALIGAFAAAFAATAFGKGMATAVFSRTTPAKSEEPPSAQRPAA